MPVSVAPQPRRLIRAMPQPAVAPIAVPAVPGAARNKNRGCNFWRAFTATRPAAVAPAPPPPPAPPRIAARQPPVHAHVANDYALAQRLQAAENVRGALIEPAAVDDEADVAAIDAACERQAQKHVRTQYKHTLAAFIGATRRALADGTLSDEDIDNVSANVLVAIPRLAVVDAIGPMLTQGTCNLELLNTDMDAWQDLQAAICQLSVVFEAAPEALLSVVRQRVACEAGPPTTHDIGERALGDVFKRVAKIADSAPKEPMSRLLQLTTAAAL